MELLQAFGQIRPAQQFIRAQGKPVAFCCRGKHAEITAVTDDLPLARIRDITYIDARRKC